MDTFNIDFNKTEELVNKLVGLLDEIRAIKKTNPSSNTAAKEYSMRSTYQSLQQGLENFERIKYEYVNNPAKFPNIRDKPARLAKIDKLKAQAGEVMSGYESFIRVQASGQADEEQPMIRVKGADGEYDDTRDLSTQ